MDDLRRCRQVRFRWLTFCFSISIDMAMHTRFIGNPRGKKTIQTIRDLGLGILTMLALETSLAPVANGQGTGSILREVWEGIPGNYLSDLTSSPDFPDRPTSTNYVTDLFEAPTDVMEEYGQRLHGYVLPPKTGLYTFWIASDDNGALYLSTDENPANARLIASVNSWTSSRAWDWEPNQQSEPIQLQANRPYYISALMKEGGGGDNLAVRWLMPDGTDQAPMVATNLLPYGVSFKAPEIAEHPASTNVVEGGTARFSIRLLSVGLYRYQWRRNGGDIAGATSPELVLSPVRFSDNNAQFSCVVTNDQGSVTSSVATLTVIPDTAAPTLVSARNLGTNQVEVVFSEWVAAASATTAANYHLDQGAAVTAAAVATDPATVILTTSALTIGTTYTLMVSGVTDQAQSPNPVASGSQVTFTVVEYTPQTIGSPPLAGASLPQPEGVDVAGSGDIGGSADNCQFAWKVRTGNFDERIRIEGFTPTDPFAKAGLMAREAFSPGSRFAAALATPSTVGCFSLTRTTAGAAATRKGYFPVNYPYTWLRLKRAANVFTAYASYDGQAWVELGSTTVGMPTTLYLGLAVGSRSSTALATAAFRNAGPVAGATTVTYTPTGETLGPSTRQASLVISEIMAHPRERADGMNGEFIELYNADLIAQDLSGYRIAGSVDYSFPAGFVLPAGGFAVIARNPAQFQVVYGRAAELGPFEGTNNLPNDAGTIRLLNPQAAVLLDVDYRFKPPWPAAADGAGHSLVLARPSYGEGDSRAWAASALIGGSPGRMEPVVSNPYASVLINEFLAHTDDPVVDFVELYNHSAQAIDISGCILTDDPGTNRFVVPSPTVLTPQGLIAFDQNQLGFRLNAAGETIYLISPDQTRVLDAVRFGPQENGVASGRYPDGAPEFTRLESPSPAAENRPSRVSTVVINEIMYNPISGDSADEYVELFNRGEQAIDLAGWEFTDGIDFRFPPGARLSGHGYAVVAKNRTRLLSHYPGLDPNLVYGDFGGTLSNAGERVALARPDFLVTTNEFGLPETHPIAIDVDEVTYGTGGRWGEWSDGLGSSLELIDPNSDHRRPSNWADSDESAKAPWSTIETTGRLDNGDGGPANRLQLMLQGAGECLVDNVEVIPSGGANRVGNPGFEQGLTGWVIQGNHRRTTLEGGAGVAGSNGLHLRAAGRGDTACNRIYTSLTSAVAANSTATLRAQVRWLKGWPEFMLRLRGSYLEAVGRLELPTNLGTPGTPNSRAVANAGPAIYDVVHSPILPAGGQSVLVTARVSDPDGIGASRLHYRTDPGGSDRVVILRDDGKSGDAVAGDGLYSALIPAQSAGTQIAFYLDSTDAHPSTPATAKFPADGPAHECLVRWGESQPVGNLGVYRLWQRQAEYDFLRNREPLANDNIDATFVYNDGRVIYNMTMRGKGSPWHGGSIGYDYVLTFPEDNPFLGAQDVALVTLGNLGSDDSAQREQAAFWIGRQLGVPTLHRRHVLFFENGGQKQNVYEDTEEPNGSYADRWWPDGEDGDLFKIEDWFEFNDQGNSFTFSRDATLERFTTTGGAYKLARYRWSWRKRAIVDSANNYTHFFNLVTAVNTSGAALVPQVENLVDIDNWMRVFALQHIVGNWDAYGFNRGKNAYIYKPVGGRFQMIPWDIDFVLGSGSDGTSADLYGSNDPVINNLWNTPAFNRVYLRAFWDATQGPLLNEQIDPILDARYQALIANGVSGVAAPTAVKTWVKNRRTYIANRLLSLDAAALAITANGGNDFSTSQSLVTLTGTAPIRIRALRVNGLNVPVVWTTTTTWSMALALGARTNTFVISGYDTWDRPVPGASDTITVRYTGTELPSPAGLVAINEIMYHPASPNAAFIELYNASPTVSFDLSNWRLDGVGLTFPQGVVLGPNSYLVVAGNRDAFAAAYGFSILPVAEFPGNLQNNGERLTLIRPGPTRELDLVVDEVRYDNALPWPPQADGLGPSLQLIDPQQDHGRVANWAAAKPTDTVTSTPGRRNSLTATITPFPRLFLNEVLPDNIAGATDRSGDRDPWIELYNAGPDPIDLGPLYLTSDYSNLTQWAFPAGTSIGPGQFLQVWADGEPDESSPGELHTSFRLSPTTGSVALVRLQAGAPVVLDYLDYKSIPANLAFGSFPDGQYRNRQLFHLPTPAAPNDPGAPLVQVRINEWLASNRGLIPDPADGDYDDWFELYNAGPTAADLSAYTLTDDPANPAKYVIPNGTTIPADGFLLIWADEEAGQTTPGHLHVNFRLSASGEAIGLFSPDRKAVDLVSFGPQADNISEGRFPDGEAEPFVLMGIPTPGEPNRFATVNQPPTLTSISPQTVDEGQTVSFTAQARDPDAGQQLTFSLAGAPASATIDAVTGAFSWLTTELDGPGEYAFLVRVTDNGNPRRSDSTPVNLTVREVNQPPQLDPISDREIDEGTALSFTVVARDADLPAQTLRFSLEPGAPDGARIHETTGTFTWTPAEAQGPNAYTITVNVSDGAPVPLSDSRTFRVTVREVDDPPAFSPVSLQTVKELSPFNLQLTAVDPDTPPRAITYTLVSGPPRLTVDASTGLVSWAPTELDGPNSYNVVVRATEVGGTQSSTLAFSIVVEEDNQAPTLAPIADFSVPEGTTITFTNVASDLDLPVQRLTFRLAAGAPEGALVDPQSGVFIWPIGGDVPPSTNTITVEVTDDALVPATARQSFQVVVTSRPRIVINEIMYQPAVAGTEFVELLNISTNTTWPLGGWRLTGMEYVFPDGTVLAPNGYLAIAKNLAAFRAAYGTDRPVVGNATGEFGPDGGLIQLFRPAAGGGEELMDTVRFSRRVPWPTAANGSGPSLQLIDARQDNQRLANWAAVNSLTTNAPRALLAMDATWRYWQDTANPNAGWTGLTYNDATWPAGAALLYVETAGLPAAKNTPLTLGPMSYFFRAKFTFDGDPEGALLQLRTIIDDGAVFYLNGKEFFRLGMEEGVTVNRDTASSRTVTDAVEEGPFVRAVDNLRRGDNVLAVEVHQVNSGSSDIVFGTAVDVIELKRESYTPAYANSVRADLEPFPSIWINEILAANRSGITDAAGDRDPWIELANAGPEPAVLAGYYLANSWANLTQWPFPASAVLAPASYHLVWADAEPAETSATEWHASFRLSSPSGYVALVRLQNGQPAIVDYLEYTDLPVDLSFGWLPDAQTPAAPVVLARPTPGTGNGNSPPPTPPQIASITLNAQGQLDLVWNATPGTRYRAQAKNRLDDPEWLTLGDITAVGNVITFRDPAVQTGPERYYRVVIPDAR